jgi:hypothetical protein
LSASTLLTCDINSAIHKISISHRLWCKPTTMLDGFTIHLANMALGARLYVPIC